MSEKDSQIQNVTIPAESSLIFEAPIGGDRWLLRNTAQGLEVLAPDQRHDCAGDRPILRLTSEGVVIRGDLIVDGEIRRELDYRKFVRDWGVIEGNSGRVGDCAVIKKHEEDKFGLYAKDPEILVQELRFNPRTGTLDSYKDEDILDRCISFWDGGRRGGDAKHRIFALRKSKSPIADYSPGDLKKYLLPWEYDKNGEPDTDGSWGAEEGGG